MITVLSKKKEQKYMEKVRMDGNALQTINEQTEAICLEAVRQNGDALEYVIEQTPQICLEAVRQNGFALRYVEKQTSQICLEAVKENSWALQYVEEQTEEIKLASLFDDYQSCDLDDLRDFFIEIDSPTAEMNLIYELLKDRQDDRVSSYQMTRLKLALNEINQRQSMYHILNQLYRH